MVAIMSAILACWFRNGIGFAANQSQAMKNAMRENPRAERMVSPIETLPAHSTGLESKTISGGRDSFSLDFSFYRTGQREEAGSRV